MKKKILAVGCSGNTSMVSCLRDAEKMYDLFCADKDYKYFWQNPPALYNGRVIAKATMTIADLASVLEWCKDCDELVVFWSSHGSLVKHKKTETSNIKSLTNDFRKQKYFNHNR